MYRSNVLILLVIVALFGIAAACSVAEEDDPIDSINQGGNSEECGIDYGVEPNCDISDPACQMVDLINKDRYDNPDEADCAPAIAWSDELAAVALAHCVDMCERDFFDHVNPDGEDPFDRMDDAGIDWVAAGENIFWGSGTGFTPEDAVVSAEDSFMNEPQCEKNHRSNILSRDFTHVGVGVYECDNGRIYLAQEFASFDFSDIRDDPHEYCPGF